MADDVGTTTVQAVSGMAAAHSVLPGKMETTIQCIGVI